MGAGESQVSHQPGVGQGSEFPVVSAGRGSVLGEDGEFPVVPAGRGGVPGEGDEFPMTPAGQASIPGELGICCCVMNDLMNSRGKHRHQDTRALINSKSMSVVGVLPALTRFHCC